MRDSFPVLQVALAGQVLDEPMGTKPKFWWADGNGQRWLFKYAREGTGEHWAEKIGAEVGSALGLPCAHVELAECEGEAGCCVFEFPAKGVHAILVHGNELLQEEDASYPMTQLRGVSKHTVGAVLEKLKGIGPPSPVIDAFNGPADAASWLVGYLLLDALIVNGDRHHENWGVLHSYGTGERTLAPSYDHASSLGRELREEERAARLTGRDPRHTVKSYLERARSAFYDEASSAKPLSPSDAFFLAAKTEPDAARFWMARLRALGQNGLEEIVGAVPSAVLSPTSASFALEVMRLARGLLLKHSE